MQIKYFQESNQLYSTRFVFLFIFLFFDLCALIIAILPFFYHIETIWILNDFLWFLLFYSLNGIVILCYCYFMLLLFLWIFFHTCLEERKSEDEEEEKTLKQLFHHIFFFLRRISRFCVVNNWIEVQGGTSLTVSTRYNSINHVRYSLFWPKKKKHWPVEILTGKSNTSFRETTSIQREIPSIKLNLQIADN